MAQTAQDVADKSLGKRLTSLMLIVVIPVLVSLTMLGAALQFVLKVPVWQDAVKLMHGHALSASQAMGSVASGNASQGNTASANASHAKASQVKTVQLKTQLAVLQTKNSTLSHKLSQDGQAMAKLQSQYKALQKQLKQQLSKESEAQKQAAILKGMDPSAAAQVLAKLPTAAAADVVAVMNASTSGPILAQMTPAAAGKLLTLASQVQFPQQSSQAGNPTTGAPSANSSQTVG